MRDHVSVATLSCASSSCFEMEILSERNNSSLVFNTWITRGWKNLLHNRHKYLLLQVQITNQRRFRLQKFVGCNANWKPHMVKSKIRFSHRITVMFLQTFRSSFLEFFRRKIRFKTIKFLYLTIDTLF